MVIIMIGTSDNLEVEAVSEAASTHSVSSSIELEDQNDNLSDMLSANVSGRGTPDVSGRNSPLSQAEQEEVNANNAALDDNDIIMDESQNQQPPNHIPPNLNNLNINGPRNPSKQARSEIEDKFCKFEIKKMFGGGDETISLVSDTWSTDVLASDSEMGGEAQQTLNQLGQLNVGNRISHNNAPVIELATVVNQDSNLNTDTMSEVSFIIYASIKKKLILNIFFYRLGQLTLQPATLKGCMTLTTMIRPASLDLMIRVVLKHMILHAALVLLSLIV
jgi:hypothetical protein